MSFDKPWLLYFLILFFVSIPVTIIRHRKSRERAALFAAAAPSAERKFLLRELRSRMIVSDIFFLLFIGFLIIALAGPRWGMRIVADYRRSVDVVMAFDISRSMNVRDCPGRSSARNNISRFDRGIEIARSLTSSVGDLRLGAAISKGRGVLGFR